MASVWITISALRRYAKEAKIAQEKLNDAKAEMKEAAEALCSVWKGDAATAFAEEQGILDNWFIQLLEIGSAYISAVLTAADKYEENEKKRENLVHT